MPQRRDGNARHRVTNKVRARRSFKVRAVFASGTFTGRDYEKLAATPVAGDAYEIETFKALIASFESTQPQILRLQQKEALAGVE